MSLKLKIRSMFPALVSAASPLVLIKTGLAYAFSFDVSALLASLDPLYAKISNNLSDLAFKYTAKDNISIHGADIASAATVNLETATGDLVDVTGTTTITAITLNEGHERTVRFTGILTLTNGASLVLPSGASITTAAGDFAVFRGYAAGVVRCISYQRASGSALTIGSGTLPTTQVFLTGSGTYTKPANALWIEVELVGGGGGGAGSGTTPGNGGNGGNTTFSTLTGTGGNGAIANSSGGGGAASGGFVNKAGASGGVGSGLTSSIGGFGANSPYGGSGVGGAPGGGSGVAAAANTGSGGGGGGVNATVNGGGGGGSGGFVRAVINSPAATYSYAVGASGAAGTTGTSGAPGGAGGSGFIQVIEHYGA